MECSNVKIVKCLIQHADAPSCCEVKAFKNSESAIRYANEWIEELANEYNLSISTKGETDFYADNGEDFVEVNVETLVIHR